MEDFSESLRQHGKVEVTELPKLPTDHPLAARVSNRALYSWIRPEELVGKLPLGHRLCLEGHEFSDGIRRFFPISDYNLKAIAAGNSRIDATAFALFASIGGRGLL